MSEGQHWQPPVPPVPPPLNPGRAAGAQLGGSPGWAPPPRPGLVPLRPMTLGTILGASFRVLRRNPKPTLGASLVINLGIVVIVSIVGGLIFGWAASRIDAAASQEDQDAIAAGAVALGAISGVLLMLLSLVGTSLLQGIVVSETAREVLGERLSLGHLWELLQGRIGALIGWGFLFGAIIGGAVLLGGGGLVGVFALLAVGAAAGGGGAAAVGAAFLGLLIIGIGVLGLLLIVMSLNTKLAFVPAGIVLERLPVFAAIRRSWQLTRGRFWRTFGILLLILVIINIASQIVTVPVSLAAGIIGVLVNPNGYTGSDDQAYVITVLVTTLVSFFIATVVAAIGLVIQSATQSLLYIDARMRSEGLDLELARYVEARQAGIAQEDPYAPRRTA